MHELLQAAISPVNIVFTTLLIVVLLYWLSVILGALHIDSFDFDFDKDIDLDIDVHTDVDTDIDVDAHADHDVNSGHGAGWFAGALHFFNFGRLPFMVIMTFLILSMWSISILLNHYFGNGSVIFALMLFFPNLAVSLVITKIFTTPLVPVFENLNEGVQPVDYIGLTCKLLLPASTTQMGQAEVMVEDSPLLINVRVSEDSPKPVLRGEEALILSKSGDDKYFLIEKLNP